MFTLILTWLILSHKLLQQVYYPVNSTLIDDAATHNPYAGFFYISACDCDFISGVCESNCCCDQDCNYISDICSTYVKQEYNDPTYLCQRQNSTSISNTNGISNYFALGFDSPSMFCVSTENLADIVVYYDGTSLWSQSAEVTLLLNEDPINPMIDMMGYSNNSTSPVLTLDNSGVKYVGYNGLMNDCGFIGSIDIYSTSFECYVKYSSLNTTCTSNQIFDSTYLFQNTTSVVYNKIGYKLNVTLGSIYYYDGTNYEKLTSLQQPIYTSGSYSCTCNNAIKKVTYNFYYYANYQFTDLKLDISLSKLTRLCNQVFEANIKVNYRFYNVTQYSNITSQVIVDLSGNPGYVYNKQLIAATLANSTIAIYKDYMPITGLSSGSSACSTSSAPILLPIIKFGQGVTYSCQLPSQITQDNCNTINSTIGVLSIINALKGTYFAKIAIPDSKNVNNWITPSVLAPVSFTNATFSNGVCRNVVYAINIIFEYDQINSSSQFYIYNIQTEIDYRNIQVGSTGTQYVFKYNIGFKASTNDLLSSNSYSYIGEKIANLFAFISTARLLIQLPITLITIIIVY